MEEKTIEQRITELKAGSYDALTQIQYFQTILQQYNQRIVELNKQLQEQSKPKENNG